MVFKREWNRFYKKIQNRVEYILRVYERYRRVRRYCNTNNNNNIVIIIIIVCIRCVRIVSRRPIRTGGGISGPGVMYRRALVRATAGGAARLAARRLAGAAARNRRTRAPSPRPITGWFTRSSRR